MFRKVAVAMSGGVDSAVAALILKQKGFSVVGVYMKNWDILDEIGHCPGESDADDAKKVCQTLEIPYHHVNFVSDYWNHVFMDFISDYQNGLTPNPDVLCNKHIKFDKLLQYVTKILGADALATGHYANNSFGHLLQNFDSKSKPKLLTAYDVLKDQTFFLSQISNLSLTKTMFPLAHLNKSEVKDMARNNNLKYIAEKRESQGICMIGPRNFQNFISEYIHPKKGYFIDVDSKAIVGDHDGVHQWTVGQRCKIGGLRQAYYVVKKTSSGNIFVALGHEHPMLFSSTIFTSTPHWIHSEPSEIKNSEGFNCSMRFQHGKPLTECKIHKLNDNKLKVSLVSSLRALTPGQYAVFYLSNECLGSARILYAEPQLQLTENKHNDLQIKI